jgi:hypothetical protein
MRTRGAGLQGLQPPFIAYFAIRWLARSPKWALCVLALQLAAAVAAPAPVFLLEL